jgi:plastocyanin
MNLMRGGPWFLLSGVVVIGVMVITLGTGLHGVAAQEGAVSIVDFAFQPNSLEVTPGTTVTWTNDGAATHTVTADDGSFNSGNLAPGATFSQTFNDAGVFTYHCNIHPQMTGTIVVSGGNQTNAAQTAAVEATPAAAVGGQTATGGGQETTRAVQPPRVGVGTLALAGHTQIIVLCGLVALMLGMAAIAYRRV